MTFQLPALISWQQSAGHVELSDVFSLPDRVFCLQIEMEGLQEERARSHHSNAAITCLGLKVLSFQALDEDAGLGILESGLSWEIQDILTFLRSWCPGLEVW